MSISSTSQSPAVQSALDRIERGLARRKLDALLVTQPENRRYLSGYTATDHSIAETSGILLILANGKTPYLLTDSRYELQARAEAKGFRVKLYPRGFFVLLRRLLGSEKIKHLAFESHYFLHSTAQTLEKLAKEKRVTLAPLTGLVEELRLQKSGEELARIEAAVRMNEAVFAEVYRAMRPGQTEKEIAHRIENAMRAHGAEGPSFDTIVAAGPNGALPHAVPTDRPMEKGEPIIIDMGLRLNGYCSDMTRTVVLGTPDSRAVAMIRLVRKAQLAGQKALKAGVSGLVVDRAARSVIEHAGHGDHFGHGLGHGVGLNVHEGPSLSYRNRKQLLPNMVVTVEPGVYLPGWGGVRLENMAVVEEKGCRILNHDTTFLDI